MPRLIHSPVACFATSRSPLNHARERRSGEKSDRANSGPLTHASAERISTRAPAQWRRVIKRGRISRSHYSSAIRLVRARCMRNGWQTAAGRLNFKSRARRRWRTREAQFLIFFQTESSAEVANRERRSTATGGEKCEAPRNGNTTAGVWSASGARVLHGARKQKRVKAKNAPQHGQNSRRGACVLYI